MIPIPAFPENEFAAEAIAEGIANGQPGTLDILNCGAGHLKLSFDKDKPEEVEKAKTAVQDMLKRGYTIFIEVPDGRCKDGKGLRPVKEFDPATNEYIVEAPGSSSERVPAEKAKASGVAPIAGG